MGDLWYNRGMKSDFLSAFLGKPARARVLRVFIFNPNQHFTLAQLAKQAGVTADNALKEIAVFESWGMAKKSKMIIPLQAEPEPEPEPEKKKKTSKKKGKKTKVVKKARPTSENIWSLNDEFPHLRSLVSFVREISPMEYDEIVTALQRSGKISVVLLSGTFMGDLSRPADLVVAADVLDERKLEAAIHALEPVFGHEIRYAAFTTNEFRYRLSVHDRLIRDTLDYPHLILLDRPRVL
jgi:hypothetical protein